MIKFPDFVLDQKTAEICKRLLGSKMFDNQKQLELEAMQLLVHAQAATACGKEVASIDVKAKSVRVVKLAYMSKMQEAGLVGKTTDPAESVLKSFLSDPQGYVGKLVQDGVFASIDEFCEQSLILIAFAFAELSGGRSMASVNDANSTYAEWTFPLSKRMTTNSNH